MTIHGTPNRSENLLLLKGDSTGVRVAQWQTESSPGNEVSLTDLMRIERVILDYGCNWDPHISSWNGVRELTLQERSQPPE